MKLRRRYLLLAALLLIPFVVPVPGVLERMRGLRSLGVLAHFFLPGGLALLLYRVGPLRGSILRSCLVAFALAVGAELFQAFVGRSPRFQDAAVDLAGVAALGGGLVWRRDGRRAALLLACAAGMVLLVKLRDLPGFVLAERAVAERMPLIADFETDLEWHLWRENKDRKGCLGRTSADGDGGCSLVLGSGPSDIYVGALAWGLPRDWSGYRTLRFKARQDSGPPCRIVARLDDYESRSDAVWIGEEFRLGAEWRTFRLDLSAAADRAERPFRLDDIDSLLLYLGGVRDEVRVWIDDIELE